MKRQTLIFCSCLMLGLSALNGQTIDSLNEGLTIHGGGPGSSGSLSWFGRENRTYFIQKSENLLEDWTYAPLIEPGMGQPVSWNFTASSDQLFLRLRYTDRVTINPNSEDYDQDKINNVDELFEETDPFSASDDNENGVPDDWEIFWFDSLDVVTPTSSHADGDDFTDAQEYAMGTDPTAQTVLSVVYLGGDNQIATADTVTPDPLLLAVEDVGGKRIKNAPVTFIIGSGFDRLARVVSGRLPLQIVPVSASADYGDSIVILTDTDGVARLDYEIHPLAPAGPGQSLVVRGYVTESVNYYDFTVHANQDPTDIIFNKPGTSDVLTAIDLPDTVSAGTAVADLDFLDADSTTHGSFEVVTFSDLFSIVRDGSDWTLVTAADSDFFEKTATVYDLEVAVADGHGGLYSETIPVTVTDADPADSPVLAAPAVSQAGGEFQTELSLTLDNSNGCGLIFYTLDGSDPKIEGQLYTPGTSMVLASGFQADGYEVIQLRAVIRDNGIADSAELTETYTFKPSGAALETFIRIDYEGSATIGKMILTTATQSFYPIPKARLGYGWIVNGTFVPDLGRDSEEIYVVYYDPTGYSNSAASGDERYVLAALGDSAIHWPSSRKMRIGRGWVGKPGGVNVTTWGGGILEDFTGVFIADEAYPETIYAGFKSFKWENNGLYGHTQAVLTTDASSLTYNHITMGLGTIRNPVGNFSQLDFAPDPALPSRPVYFGFNLFQHDQSAITTFGRWVYAYDASEISDGDFYGKIQLSDGWITGVGGLTTRSDVYQPDFSKAPVSLYGGLEWVLRTNNGTYNFVANTNVSGINQALALRQAGWIACSVNSFGTLYRGHELGLGWTTGPFSHQPYIDPNGFAGNPPRTDVRYRRLTWDEDLEDHPESGPAIRMDYLAINPNDPVYSPDFYAPSAPGWPYREKNREIDMDAFDTVDEFIALGYDTSFFLSSLDPMFSRDTDHDGIADGYEKFSYRTDPYLADTDGDLIPDGVEVAAGAPGLDPHVKNDPLAVGYIQDVALLGQGIGLPESSGPVEPEVPQVNSGHPYAYYGAWQPPQVLTGSRYRKIGLNGFPLPDEPPQAEEEEDQEKEETYVDAFDLTLKHSVTDIYVPLPGGSDLALQVRRNFSGSVWSSDTDWRPGERLDRPFGAGWSSNLCAFVKRVVVYDSNGSYEEIYVQDESGVLHRFYEYQYDGTVYYLAIPDSRSQQDALLSTLTRDGTKFIFTQKYGTTLTFETDEIDQGWSFSDRDGYNYFYRRNYFSRASTITDRHGNTLDFSYEHVPSDANASLIPELITFNGRNEASQTIRIDADRKRVHSITDPRGHTIYYDYENLVGGVADSYGSTYTVPVLRNVEFARSSATRSAPGYDAEISTYTYDLAGEPDYSFSFSGGRMCHLNLATIGDGNQNTYRFSYDFNRTNRVAGATGNDGNTMWYVRNGYPRQVVRVDLPGSGASARFKNCGLSQYVNDATVSQSGTSWDDYLAGYRATVAYDAENNAHVYQFNDPRVEMIDDPFKLSDNDPRLMYFLEMKLSHYQGSSVTLIPPALTEGTAGDPATFASGVVEVVPSNGTTLLGSETFDFDLTSGLQLASITDFSGNVTDYFYDYDYPDGYNSVITKGGTVTVNGVTIITSGGCQLNPYLSSTSGYAGKLPEPSRKIVRNAHWNGSTWEDVVETYTYGKYAGGDADNDWFLMDSIVDGNGRKTVYDIDTRGNRASETVYAASDSGTPVERTTYAFEDADFFGVATSKTVEDLDGSDDLAIYYGLDDLGRIQLQAVDVLREGSADHPHALVTAFAYDTNSNRTHMVDPNTAAGVADDLSDPAAIQANATYTWSYDNRNRRTSKQYPATLHPVTGSVVNPAATEYSVYDQRGNRVGEIDLNGHITVNQYDGLNRKVRSIRIMGASTLSPDDPEAFRHYTPVAADLVSEFGYNRLNSMVFQEDAEKNRCQLFYDGLQRLRETIDAAGNHTTYEYDPAANTGSGAFDRDSFKPTRTVNARNYEIAVEYDPQGHPVLQFAQYAQDSPNRYRVTAYQYDAAGNTTHEKVYPDYAGSPDAASFAANMPGEVQITRTDYDARNRPTVRTRADGSKERYTYTSTGLLELEQLFQPGEDPDTGSPFRQQRHYHDGAGRVLASRSLPVAPENEGEITWVITGQRYDANGNIVESIDPRNVQYGDIGTYAVATPPVPDHSGDLNWQTRYDSRNRPVMQIEPRSENLTRTLVATDSSESTETLDDTRPYTLTEYDQVGNEVVTTDAFGQETVKIYDAANRPTHEFTPPVPILDPFDTTQLSMELAHLVKRHVHDKNGNILQTRSGLAAVAGSVTPGQYLSPADAIDTEGTVLWPDTSVPARPTAQTAVTWLRTDVTNTYDALNRLETTTDGEGITVVNEYDAAGNRTAMTDGEQQRTEFEYDGFNRNTTIRHPDHSEKSFSFNALVQTGRTDEEGQSTRYAYDALNRLKTVDYASDSVIDREYFYDPEGNILAVTEAPGDGTRQTNVAYAYDAAGRLVKECLGATHQSTITSNGVAFGELATGVGGDGVTHQYERDLAGNLTVVRYGASSRVLRTTYDLLNRALTIDEDVNDDGAYDPVDGDRRTRYVYDLRGSIVRKDTADGLSIRMAYDALQRTRQITGPLDDYGVARYQYRQSYDFAGNVGRIDENYPSFLSKLNDRTIRNTYDLADRLTLEAITTGNEVVATAYGYDDAHNRISKVLTKEDGINPMQTLENVSYTLNNELNQVDGTTDSVSGESVSFTYDLNGARKTKIEGTETTGYGYDYENRLTSLTNNDGSYSYAYDYRTRRTVRDESYAGGDKTFVIYSDGLSVQEWKTQTISDPNLEPGSADDTKQVEYVRGSGLGGGIAGLLYTVRDLDEDGALDDIRLNHYNARGDLVAQTDDRGEVMYQAAYEAFGESGDASLGGDADDPRTQTEGATADRQRSNTKDRDPTGLINDGMRYRSDHLYLTRDPLGFVDGPNVYTYVVQNPWTKFDPHGLKFDEATFDRKKDRMKKWDEIDEKAKDRFKKQFKGADDHERDYNGRVNSFNTELNKLRETPFGSAQYDYLKNHNDTFTLQFGAGSDGSDSTRSFVRNGVRDENASYTIAGMDSFRTIAHEFQHLVQTANPAYGNMSSLSYQKMETGPFTFLADRSDGNARIPVEGGISRPAFQEFQAQRAKNIAENEYNVLNSVDGLVQGQGRVVQTGPTSWEMQTPRVQPTLQLLQTNGVDNYNNGGGNPNRFQHPSGSYDYKEVLNFNRR